MTFVIWGLIGVAYLYSYHIEGVSFFAIKEFSFFTCLGLVGFTLWLMLNTLHLIVRYCGMWVAGIELLLAIIFLPVSFLALCLGIGEDWPDADKRRKKVKWQISQLKVLLFQLPSHSREEQAVFDQMLAMMEGLHPSTSEWNDWIVEITELGDSIVGERSSQWLKSKKHFSEVLIAKRDAAILARVNVSR